LHPNQRGFRAGKEISMNLEELFFCIRTFQQKKKKNGYVLFVDLKAAFDSVVHKILFEKMEKMGFD